MSKQLRLTALCLLFCYIITLSSCTHKTTNTLEDYLHTNVPLVYSEHRLFPDKSDLSEESINCYRSESKSSFLFDDIYFLLSRTYSQEEYLIEISRLANTGAEFQENLFAFPAYVFVFYNNYYEYALLDSEKITVIYIHAETADWEIFADFPDEYRPINSPPADICHYAY